MNRILVSLLLLLVATACLSPKGMISAEAILPAVEVLTQEHAAYVNADVTLTIAQKEQRTRSDDLLLETVREAAGMPPR